MSMLSYDIHHIVSYHLVYACHRLQADALSKRWESMRPHVDASGGELVPACQFNVILLDNIAGSACKALHDIHTVARNRKMRNFCCAPIIVLQPLGTEDVGLWQLEGLKSKNRRKSIWRDMHIAPALSFAYDLWVLLKRSQNKDK